jgi:hypothetical protein
MTVEEIKLGMVVRHKSNHEWVQIKTRPDADGNLYINGSRDTWCHVSELRLLTARERGETQKVQS